MMAVEIKTDAAPAAIGPYSQAISFGSLIFISGQLPIDPATNKIEAATIEEQADQCLRNLKAILQSQGLTLQHIVKTTIMLQDLAHFDTVNRLYAEAFSSRPFPARSTFQVAALPKGALVEIEAIASR